MGKTALITGITGQDGSYLAELLLEKGYTVFGMIRRSSHESATNRIQFIMERDDALEDPDDDDSGAPKVKLLYGDLSDSSSVLEAIRVSKPDEIYSLGAQSHVGISFKCPEYTTDVVAMGPLRILEAVRKLGIQDDVKIYQASSSEQFGDALPPQSEITPFRPRSPYAISKHYAFQTFQNYREAYNMFCVNGILFNHESPRRGTNFVTRKITRNVASIKLGLKENFQLGNIYSKRDWGHAKDYVKAMWMMLQQEKPDDYVVATGVVYNIKEFAEIAFAEIGEKLTWEGEAEKEVAKNQHGVVRISINPKLYRATEVGYLHGDSSKARQKLGWTPEYTLPSMAKEMVACDLEDLQHSDKYFALKKKEKLGNGYTNGKRGHADTNGDARYKKKTKTY